MQVESGLNHSKEVYLGVEVEGKNRLGSEFLFNRFGIDGAGRGDCLVEMG